MNSPWHGIRAFSGFNSQRSGIDEFDGVKTDDHHVYFATGDELRIASVNPPKLISATKLEGMARGLIVHADRAVVIAALNAGLGHHCILGRDCAITKEGDQVQIIVYDLTKKESPLLVRKLEVPGSVRSVLRAGKIVHAIVANLTSAPAYPTRPRAICVQFSVRRWLSDHA